MATQPFDPTVLAAELKSLGAASNITEKLKSDWSDISKNLSEQEKNQRRLNILSSLQSDISATISEQKKASIVYDEASFNLEKRKLDLQQEIYQAQMDRIDVEMNSNNLIGDQLKAAESFRNNILMQKIALEGTLKVYEKQKNVGSAIDKQSEATNDEIKKLKKNIDESNKSFQFTLKHVEKIFEKLSSISENVFKSLKVPSTVGSSLSKILDIFNEIDTAATNVRQKFGLLPSQGAIFEKNIREASIQLAEFGINAEQLGGTMKQIGSTFTSLQSMEKGLVKDVSIMSAQFGISAETSAKFLQTLGGVSGKSAIAKQNMLGLAKFAANAYGVGLEDVMNDVANASDASRMFAGKNADELVRAAAQARQMGTTLDNMANTAKGLLDFESSIQSELKASALIGKNINFNEARRLAFQGDIIGANKLILDQAKKIKFNQLNPIAQDAFAKAAGKSVKELQEMLNAEENLKEALKSKDPLVRAEAEKKKQMAEMMKKDPIAAKKAAQAEYEKGLIQEKNQTRVKQLQNEINAIFMEFVGPILEQIGPIFTELLKYIKENKQQIIDTAKEIGKWFSLVKTFSIIFSKEVAGPIGSTLTYVGKLTGGVFKFTESIYGAVGGAMKLLANTNKIATGFPKISTGIKIIGSLFSGIGKTVGGVGRVITSVFSGIGGFFAKASGSVGLISKIGPLFGAVAKFLGPIGVVISVIQGGIAFFKAFSETAGTTSQKAVAGLKAVVNALVIEPLKMVWDFIKKIPSFLADIDFGEIYKEVTTFLLDALTSLPDKIEELFSGGGIQWGKIFFNIGNLFFQMIMFSAIKLPIAIATLVLKLGVLILKGIVSIGASLLDALMWPFKTAYNLIMDLLGGKSPSKIGLAIVDGIKSVVDMLFDVLTYPFEKASKIIPGIINILKTIFVDAFKSVVDIIFDLITYPFKKAFQLIKSAVAEVGSVLKDTFSGAFTFIINALEKVLEKLKGVGGFITDLVGKGFSFVGKILGVTDEPTNEPTGKSAKVDEKYKGQGLQTDSIINAIVSSNKAVVEKLDKLTSMMASGQIAVYIDGQRANQLLATSNSKFGSFGQATTN
jgi:hypothetical protein